MSTTTPRTRTGAAKVATGGASGQLAALLVVALAGWHLSPDQAGLIVAGGTAAGAALVHKGAFGLLRVLLYGEDTPAQPAPPATDLRDSTDRTRAAV